MEYFARKASREASRQVSRKASRKASRTVSWDALWHFYSNNFTLAEIQCLRNMKLYNLKRINESTQIDI